MNVKSSFYSLKTGQLETEISKYTKRAIGRFQLKKVCFDCLVFGSMLSRATVEYK